MAKDVSKGNAIKALCHKLGYSVDQVIAFGDSMNEEWLTCRSIYIIIEHTIQINSSFSNIRYIINSHDLGYIEHEYMNIEAELTGLPMKRVDDIKAYIQGDVPKV
jgi:hypothetical protein